MRFWLDRGVDGFRVDVIWHDQGRPVPRQPAQPRLSARRSRHIAQLRARSIPPTSPRCTTSSRGMREVLDELPRPRAHRRDLPADRAAGRLLRRDGSTALHLPFNFLLISLPWQRAAIATLIDALRGRAAAGRLAQLGARQPRPAAHRGRIGLDQARVAAMLLLTLSGTPTIYYGDEIGMPRRGHPPDRVQDPFERTCPGSGVGETAPAPPCSGMPRPMRGFPGRALAAGSARIRERQRRARAARSHVHLQSLPPADRGASTVAVVAGGPLPAHRGDRGPANVRPRARA